MPKFLFSSPGNFKKIPTKIIELRQIKMMTTMPVVGGPTASVKYKIGDYFNKQRLKIAWSAGL